MNSPDESRTNIASAAGLRPSYLNRFSSINSYARTLDYYRLMFCEGPFESTEESRSVDLIDQINYAVELFPDVLPLGELISLFPMEPGYGAVDGSIEIGPFVRGLEQTRARACAVQMSGIGASYSDTINEASIGLGCGVTGALTIAVGSILQVVGCSRSDIISVTPNYCIIEEVGRLYGCRIRNFPCDASHSFLPDLQSVVSMCDDRTAAICLTVPTNPSHNAWTISDAEQVRKFIRWCQEKDVFVIFDMIFQDLDFSNEPIVEPFALAESNRSVVKLFGPSKDRPFAGGHRIGYFIGDSRLGEPAQHLSHIMINSPPFYSKVWLAFDLFFREKLIRGVPPSREDCAVFNGTFLFGEHYENIGQDMVWQNLCDCGTFERYRQKVAETHEQVRSIMREVHGYLASCACFQTLPLPSFGNSLMVKVCGEYFQGTDHEFFLRVLRETNVGLLVGNAFGLPCPNEEVWFRVVCVAERADVLIERLARVVRLLNP
jgi:aspartate/methionine/tyrosine aminotransferase